MKYKDIKYYIDKYHAHHIFAAIDYIDLSTNLFDSICKDICESHFEIFDQFEYDGLVFKLEKAYDSGNNIMVVCLANGISFSYPVLTENERLIKSIIE